MAIADLAYIDATGYHYPDYPTVLQYYQDSYRAIYGNDVYIEADSQDGQWIAIQATAAYDCLALGAAVYNSFSPATALDDALSRDVKINGIARKIATNSTVDVRIVGVAGTTITNGVVQSIDGTQWTLPVSVVIPPAGEITVTATATAVGAIQATVGSVNKIYTPTQGWQTVSNLVAANAGAPVESNAELRLRQSQSVALPSRSILEGTTGAIANITGVTRLNAVDNDTNVTDSNGVTANKTAFVVEGGNINDIAMAIANKKGPGGGTFGTQVVNTTNIYGTPVTIRFSRPTYDAVSVAIGVKALSGYVTATGDAIKLAVANYINNVAIGGGLSKSVEWADAITAANSVGGGTTYKIASLTLTGPGGAGTPDVPLLYDHAPQTTTSAVVLTVT